MFWFTVTCILCKNAIGESISTRIFASINNASQLDAGTEITQNERLIELQTRPVETAWKNDILESEILHKSPRVNDISVKTKILNEFGNVKCFGYVNFCGDIGNMYIRCAKILRGSN